MHQKAEGIGMTILHRLIAAFSQWLDPPKPPSFLARFREWTRRMDGPNGTGRYLVSKREYANLLRELDDSHCIHIPQGNGIRVDGFTVEPDATMNDGYFEYHST
jgi:hypothetical protein